MPAKQPSYLRPASGEWSVEIEIKRSRFIALASRTADEASARSFIDAITSRYPDARHHCTAFVIQVDGAQPIERSSDDGEPAGTAGQPMLEVLRGSGLQDVTVVVVRYFGGVKLGTGGLVRAYQDATKAVLEKVQRVRRSMLDVFTVEVPHADAGRIEAELRGAGIQVLDVEYSLQAMLTVAVTAGKGEELDGLVAKFSGGTLEAKEHGQRWIDSDESEV